jgi:hypothetical protein
LQKANAGSIKAVILHAIMEQRRKRVNCASGQKHFARTRDMQVKLRKNDSAIATGRGKGVKT